MKTEIKLFTTDSSPVSSDRDGTQYRESRLSVRSDHGPLLRASRYLRSDCRCTMHMGRSASELEEYTTELIQRIDELREKRDEITKMLQTEEDEKASIQKDMVVLTKRLAEIDESLSRKYAYINEYDKTIEDVEAAYSKVITLQILGLRISSLNMLHL